ncbi:putative hemolysin-III channel protein Izh2 [Stachybotrys elegans]|uniref:Hemolysin-III channel protein Izh2 n=1 Tax=Stachybotrys elegans TaxID=80388 RepID=A0A8K0SF05_9HYPO|nr:putative hemolysin-III channel protein Izh2 [Stachybotrys elegans]
MGESSQDGGLRQRRTSNAAETLISTAKEMEHAIEDTLLMLWDELPSWRRDNAFIKSGYRQSRGSYMHSLRSLFYIHNESVNIWSHLVGAVCAAAASLYLYGVIHPRYESANFDDVVVFGCFFAGAVLCLGMSATFHMLLNHSETVATWGNKLDYTGIVALIVGSYVPALYYGLFCRPSLMKVYLILICTLGTGCGLVSWIDRFRRPELRAYRALMFVALGLSSIVPIVHAVSIYGYQGLDERMSVSLVILHGAMYIFGAFLYAVRWPERSAPGSFDIWGNSHQIFHFFVVLAAATHLYAMARAFDYHHTVASQCI